jgi:hypothetical protein
MMVIFLLSCFYIFEVPKLYRSGVDMNINMQIDVRLLFQIMYKPGVVNPRPKLESKVSDFSIFWMFSLSSNQSVAQKAYEPMIRLFPNLSERP